MESIVFKEEMWLIKKVLNDSDWQLRKQFGSNGRKTIGNEQQGSIKKSNKQ